MILNLCCFLAAYAPFVLCLKSQLRLQFPGESISHALPDELQGLNNKANDKFISGLPVGLPCYNNFNGIPRTRNDTECNVVEKNKNNADFLTSQMTGYPQGNWGICQSSGLGCPTSPITKINESAPCNQGSIPAYIIDVQQVSDVQRGLATASVERRPVVVKASGHDYKGRSSGPDSVALWTYNYRPPIELNKSFIPEGCNKPVGDVVTFGAGQDFDGLYKFAEDKNITIIGGSSETVAPGGGWITGGGHSALSPAFGLGVDNVEQIKTVLPNGTYTTLSHCQNQDLFFAVRGGGGGTFGVNMEISFRVHPKVSIQFLQIVFEPIDPTITYNLLTILVAHANRWHEEGWGGYIYPTKYGPRNASVTLINPRLSRIEAQASLEPLITYARSLGIQAKLENYLSFYPMYEKYIKGQQGKSGNFGNAMASRLIPSTNFESKDNQKELVDALVNSAQNKLLMLLLVAPNHTIADADSAVTPAWRRSTWHVLNAEIWDPSVSSVEQIEKTFSRVSQSMDGVRALTPGAGAYINEADTFEPDPVGAFWGRERWERLSEIKGEIDPEGLMLVHQGIGAEEGGEERFRCYPNKPNTKGKRKGKGEEVEL